jgi:hypothetical protein
VVLHENHFDGLGGDGRPAGDVTKALAAAFSSLDAWRAEFRRTAMSLLGGSGWAVLTYNRHTQSLHNYWAWDHMHGAVTGAGLIALDMYEHSYHMDCGTAAAKYVDAVMANLSWERSTAATRRRERSSFGSVELLRPSPIPPPPPAVAAAYQPKAAGERYAADDQRGEADRAGQAQQKLRQELEDRFQKRFTRCPGI